ncbi:methionine synthase (B12-dependent) [Actinokineospora alba]|uniref:Methionine synthase n=1 Tax=Actinokineospora alba TaxID=504798 RepID=A0A1H0GK12_9PSEU|nr:methionine synthase [Actinokineospora alba]TDP69927.1 methionine synthase (B12-dependent) [Actinokineospora alba]SDI05748.1 5-methyltetrahydrofolate--homocysteine methyltransferase [Actinokineospora alba]SDO07194.1 methionine synthase (B12-dependent) [Actinokineospora alba]
MPDSVVSPFIAALNDRVLVADGAMGTMLQGVDLTLDDFAGLEGCNEILNITRPDVVRQVHREYFEAGSDAVETNTFGANLANLAEYDIPERIFELSESGARLAREVADEFSTAEHPRFVLGSVGPGTKLPTLGHAPYATLRDAYQEQVRGMLVGGIDAVIVETSQDLLQTKASIIGAKRAMAAEGRIVPIITQVTVETTGTMLLGTEIGAALTALEPLGIDLIGLNCATGPAEMSEHLRTLSKHARIPLSVMPNAGLPELGPNGAVYPLKPDELAVALSAFVTDFGTRLVGGCCGTTGEHIRQVVDAVRELTPAPRKPRPEPGVSSLYQAVPFQQDASVLVIGERTNANGSKAFREAMLNSKFDDCIEIARAQTRDGAHMLDLCVDYVGRDGAVDMAELAGRLATASTLPIMLDSTEPEVIRAGLERLGGRCAVNSVNFEDGDGPTSRYHRMMELVREHGAAVVVMCIDEEGQARTAVDKVRIAARTIDALVGDWGMRVGDIIVDCLTFPITTGQEEVRKDAIETIEAIRQLKQRYPEVKTTLGVSNVSFGLNAAARQVLNSVFLHECVQAGLDTAIVHASKIVPMARIPDERRAVALDLVYDRRREGYDPLQKLMELFEGATVASSKATRAQELAALPLFDRLERRIVDGERKGLGADLDEALKERPALQIINDTLLAGMKTVGELFGSGQMQLPFVLQSAEVMKAAVAHLEPHMEKSDDDGKGRIVLATVKGDVHDIGKNLVDIILSNNGYDVVNLGIKQPITTILDAAEEHRADVIGMSGLLVKSTVIMKENLEEMNSRNVAAKWPVMLGGAALTRAYVENDLTDMYLGDVRYARDAFEGLRLMDAIMAAKRGESPLVDEDMKAKAAERRARRERSLRIAEARKAKEAAEEVEQPARSDVSTDVPVPNPPFWGNRIIKGVPVADYSAMLDERATFMGQWGLKGVRGGAGPSYEELVETEGRPRLRYWLDRLATEGVLAHAAVVYGYFPCVSEGDDLVILTEPTVDAPERTRFTFPRQPKERRLCLADFFRPRESGVVDVVGFSLVTMGQPIADFANELFTANAYRDYLEVHGLGVQLAEALAEYWHRRIREELTFAGGKAVADEDPADIIDYFSLGYRGARFSLGYGACPNLEDRAKIVDLLDPERIGVKLSEEFQLHPEQSTDAIVLHHPEAKYFNT